MPTFFASHRLVSSSRTTLLALVVLSSAACGTTVTDTAGDVIDLDGVDLNDIDLDGVDISQDILDKIDALKQDVSGVDADVQAGTDAQTTGDVQVDTAGQDTAQADTTQTDTAQADSATADVGCTSIAACDDGDACTTDICGQSGQCVHTSKLADCDDSNVCTTDTCDPATGCKNTPNTLPCDDGIACTLADTCTDTTCVGLANDVSCADGNACTEDHCFASGKVAGCVNTPISEATCSDGSVCTLIDVCKDGACLPGDVSPCDDGNVCTNDSCDAVAGCVALPNTATCEGDGNLCTTDTCSEGTCTPGAPKVCGPQGYDSANLYCTTLGYCDYTDGQCKTSTQFVWAASFAPTSPWTVDGQWQIGAPAASSGQTWGNADPGTDADGDGYIAGSAIGGNLSATDHDWHYLTSPVIDLSAYAASTYLTGATFDTSLILDFQFWINLLPEAGQTAKVEVTGDGQTWTPLWTQATNISSSLWFYSYELPSGNILLPKAVWTSKFQVRFGYRNLATGANPPDVSGISIDHVQIGVGNCWD